MGADALLVAIDFTAAELQLLLAEPDGRPLHHEAWPLPELPDGDAWSWEVGGRIAASFATHGEGRSARAIAVAAPGPVDPVAGQLLQCAEQPGWDGLAIVDALRRHIDAPVAAESRTLAALLGEHWQGAAAGADDVLYVSLHGTPAAAAMVGGRPVRGAQLRAGALPALPRLAEPLTSDDAEAVVATLADLAALLDPAVVVLDGAAAHVERLAPLLQRVLDEVAPGPRVVAGELRGRAALIGALRMATTLAFEGQRKP
ncbi:MAG: ROK family protein [Dehalococcoidia bacterium]|nr:ROK family protein [Dehalococcoidia bacterium]